MYIYIYMYIYMYIYAIRYGGRIVDYNLSLTIWLLYSI